MRRLWSHSGRIIRTDICRLKPQFHSPALSCWSRLAFVSASFPEERKKDGFHAERNVSAVFPVTKAQPVRNGFKNSMIRARSGTGTTVQDHILCALPCRKQQISGSAIFSAHHAARFCTKASFLRWPRNVLLRLLQGMPAFVAKYPVMEFISWLKTGQKKDGQRGRNEFFLHGKADIGSDCSFCKRKSLQAKTRRLELHGAGNGT